MVVLDEVCERNVGFQCQDLEADHAAMCVKVDVDVSGLERGSNTPDCANLTCILFASPVARRVTLPALVVFTDTGRSATDAPMPSRRAHDSKEFIVV